MASNSGFLSQTLQSITTTKMREQGKRRKAFETRKAEIVKSAEASEDERNRLKVLLSGFEKLSSSNKGVSYVDAEREVIVKNINTYLEQSYRDPAVSSTLLRNFETNLRQKLDQESERFDFADLYYRLLTEWTDPDSRPIIESEQQGDGLDGQFEHVQKYTLQNLKDKFTSVAFTARETDEVEIDLYMSSLFEDDYAKTLIEQIRERVRRRAKCFKETTNPFNTFVLRSSIKALLTNDLLNDDAKNTLAEFSDNNVVLDEIADVLNLRFADLDNWSWDAPEGMYYEPRRQPNGKFRIMMDQDILQALFLHYIAITWCADLKGAFESVARDAKFWKGPKAMTDHEESRYHYFHGMSNTKSSQKGDFVTARQILGDDPDSGGRHALHKGLIDEKADTFQNTFLLSAMPTSLVEHSDPYADDGDPDVKNSSGLERRQLLHRQIATDIIVRRALHGDVAVVQSDLQWYASGLPHSTLWAVLRFWGIPEDWLQFFKKFAEAPLRMSATPGEDVRTRKRGIPITDAFEKFFGESVLFCMDVAVNRLSGTTLIRFHDDLWLSGDPGQCAHAWETIEGFVRTLGLDINTLKTGSAYLSNGEKDATIAAKFPKGKVVVGMLQLTEEGNWIIDQRQVAAHRQQLHTQLGACTSIISWIQTWNACMGNFFQRAFGKPANCFGQDHLNAILDTYADMQRELFASYHDSVTEYLREQIARRFQVEQIPDAFFFLPETFGGLGLQNPFIPFYLLRGQLIKSPTDCIAKFQADERQLYKQAADAYNALSDSKKKRRYKAAFGPDSQDDSIINEPFASFEEYTRHREWKSQLLTKTYHELMREPHKSNIHLTNDIKPWFDELTHTHDIGWPELSSENKWIMFLYAAELKQRFGALSIVDRNLLPSGVMKMLKQRRTTWQLILWD